MPRVRVAQPSSELIRSHPREYAIFKQMANGKGKIEPEIFEHYIKQYGSGSAATTNGGESADATKDLSFEDFVALFPSKPLSVEGEGDTIGFAAHDSSGFLTPIRFQRRATGNDDIRIQITHAGVCHSDVHTAKNEWRGTSYPVLVGHEIVGIVTEVGSGVSSFKVGDRVGVGCMVNSCQACDYCVKAKEEQFCSKGAIMTYNAKDEDGSMTKGGYSTSVVVNKNFVLHIPENLPSDAAAPLLCAGITTYSPLRHYQLDKPGMKVGVMGLGGLGHMAVKLAKAMGVDVTVLSSSAKKKEEAMGVLGAQHFVVTSDEESMKAATGTLDGIINTVSAKLDLAPYLALLKNDGRMVCLGVPEDAPTLPVSSLIFKRVSISGSIIGGIRETQEMLDFCSKHNVTPMIETIPIDYINTAYERMEKNDVHYRFVIDIQGSLML